MEVVRGSTFQIEATIYSLWTGDLSSSQAANLSGADVRLFVKKAVSDADGIALATKNATIVSASAGVCAFQFAASDTNGLSYASVYYEIVCKLSDGTVIRSGIEKIALLGQVAKDLF